MFRFKCTCCGEWHQSVPGYGADAPLFYSSVPSSERATRCVLDSDTCVIDQKFFFVRGCLAIPVQGQPDPFIWGVWVSLSKSSFHQFVESFDTAKWSHIGSFFGWLSAELPLYPSTENLKVRVHLRDDVVRPYIELEPTDHPLAVEQRCGITVERVADIYSRLEHPLS